jgi:5'-nucleotidase (lipoprotein e(P4) family)
MKNYLILLLIALSGCRISQVKNVESRDQLPQTDIPVREHSIQAVLWQQHAGEYKALCYQAFNLARLQLDQILSIQKTEDKTLAIITDIDETLIDNSPYNAKMIELDKEYTKSDWVQWGKLESAKAVPGALEFLKYAKLQGVQVFYISNRYDLQLQETMNNLKKLGFPYVDENHFLLRKKTSGKESRRKSVSKDHEVVMLLGDNLSDFMDVFDKKSTQVRNRLVDGMKDDFGRKFIVLPNPMYGDWETKGIYEGRYDWSPQQKDSIRKAKLLAY